MTLAEIKNQVMFQTNNDTDDLGDFEPYILSYINDGYDRLVNAWAHQHITPEDEDWPPLEEPENENDDSGVDVPKTPEWTHKYLADWATWLIYRNGNPQKQQRGYAFRESFMTMLSMIADEGGMDGLDENGKRIRYKNFYNIPR